VVGITDERGEKRNGVVGLVRSRGDPREISAR
jgi:hypothetical protein